MNGQVMALLRYLKIKSYIPTAKETGLGKTITKEANTAVPMSTHRAATVYRRLKDLEWRKLYTSFSKAAML